MDVCPGVGTSQRDDTILVGGRAELGRHSVKVQLKVGGRTVTRTVTILVTR